MAGNQGNSRKKTTHNMHNEKKYKNPAGQERVREKSSRAKSDNVCPYAKKCGGCDYQGVEYKEQLKTKQAYMKKLLKPFCFVEPIVGMKNPLYYRHKVHAAFDCTRRGQIVAGAYRKNTHDVVDIESCMIEEQESDEIIRDIKDMLRSFRIKTYDEDTGYGLLRHVLVRKGYATGQIMVVLVLASPILPSKNNFVKALRKKHPNITTVVLNVNDKRTSMVLGDRNITLYGKGFIEDKLCGCTFRISPGSFYQVNPVQTELLYEKAIHEAHLTGKERVIDAYCGTGTIGIIAAKNAGEVIGVELNRDAIRDAVTNAKRNDIRNIRFYNDDAGKFMVEMAQKGEKADVVIMDPPRTGSDEAFLSSVVKLAPERVVYVSCGPETLARDLKYLTKHGYTVKRATPYDCFPYTEHIETVVLLSHKKADSYIHIDVEFGEGEGKIPVDSIAKRAEAYKPKEKVTYKMIKEYIEAKYGFKVHTAYIAEVKRNLGLPMYDAPNAVEELKQPRKHPTPEKVEAIKDALRYFAVI